MATVMNAKRVIIIEDTNFAYISSLAAHNIQSEIDRMREQGYFEQYPTQDGVEKYKNMKPTNIPMKKVDDEKYLLIIDGRDQMHMFRLP